MHNPFEILSFRAQVTPDFPAFFDGVSNLNFEQLHRTCVQASEKLAEAGIEPGQKVYLLLPENLAFITTMALFHRGAVSCLGLADADVPANPAFDWVISLQPDSDIQGVANISLGQEWFTAAGRNPASAPMQSYPTPDSVCRIIMTSGTTGQPKAVGLTPELIEQRLYRNHLVWGSATGNEINLMGHSSIGGFMGSIQLLQSGKPVILPANIDAFSKAISQFQVVSLLSSAMALFRLINAKALSPADLAGIREVRLAGSALTSGMVHRLKQECPAARIFNVYGSTEVGAVGMIQITHPDQVWKTAVVQPGAAAEVVDETDSPVPTGTEGIVRVRSSGMISGYMSDVADESFRDGWFYPGDRGLFRNGVLCLTGRESEVINLGGVKISPLDIESAAESVPALTDVAACQVEMPNNTEALALVYVAEAVVDIPQIAEVLKTRLPATQIPSQYFQLKEIPRNAMGKIKRRELSQMLSNSLKAQSPG